MTETVVEQRHTVNVSGFVNPLTLDTNAETNSHVKVYADDELLTLGEDYELAGIGDTGNLDEIDGVEVTILDTAAWSAYDTFTVLHDPPLDQDGDLGSGGAFGQAYEDALDALDRRLQATGSKLDRAFRLPVSAVDVSVVLPHPVENRALVWRLGDDGYYLDNTVEDPDTEPLTAATAAAVRAELAETNAETAETNAEAAAAAAQADRILAQEAAAEAGDLSALLQYLVPVGTSIMHNAASAPDYYLKENGAAVSRTTYAALYDEIGTTHGVGDGSTTFNLPESRGEFFRGLDDGRGVDSGRTIGSAQSEMIGPHSHTATIDSGGSHSHTVSITLPAYFGANNGGAKVAWAGGDSYSGSGAGASWGTTSGGSHSHTITIDNNSGTENRPRNKAKLMCIKY
jgi:microcystin-dependent protein